MKDPITDTPLPIALPLDYQTLSLSIDPDFIHMGNLCFSNKYGVHLTDILTPWQVLNIDPPPGGGTPVTYNIPLTTGWNVAGLAVNIANPTAQAICEQISSQGGMIREIDHFVDGAWSGHICGRPFNNFSLSSGKGFLIKVEADSNWTQEGPAIPSPFIVDLRSGWNFICLPDWADGMFDAQCLLDEINNQGGECLEIGNFTAGAWQTHIDGINNNNFIIVPGKGYALKCEAPLSVIIHKPGHDIDPPLIRNIAVSPPLAHSDTRAVISWTTNEPADSQVYYRVNIGYSDIIPLPQIPNQ